MRHELKIWPVYYDAVMSGKKRFELRQNDRNFKIGDDLLLKEWDPETKDFTGSVFRARITYLLVGPAFGLESDHAILSFRKLPDLGG